MIIDFHTHTFPDVLAPRAIYKLAHQARMVNRSDGTAHGLLSGMRDSGVDISLLLPISTKPGQTQEINRGVIETNREFLNSDMRTPGLLSFGAIHPENEDYKSIIRTLAAHHVAGIKLHPAYQGVPFDDIRYLRIINYAQEQGLYVITHAGTDIGLPGCEFACMRHILPALDKLDPSRLILAHMGGYEEWDAVEQYLAGSGVYFDTAFSLLAVEPLAGTDRTEDEDIPMSRKQFIRIVQKHGADRILFGTDSPWEDQAALISYIRGCHFSAEDEAKIFSENARRILKL